MSDQALRPQALVTGGTRGIGRAVVLRLAQDGYDVAFTYRQNPEQAQSLIDELRSLGAKGQAYQVDMTNTSKLKETLEQILKDFTKIEAFVSNAGVAIDGLTMRFSEEDWDRTIDTNTKAAFICAQALSRPMMKARKGSMIFISSVIGQRGNSGQVAYATSKSALFGMAKSLAQELGSRNIRANVVAPGFIKTDMTEGLPDATKASILSQIPLGSFGDVSDVANAVAFLASEHSRYITGQIIGVNGGMYM
jgi:3-oxoacyl-[acyl-carrier protein] reductase